MKCIYYLLFNILLYFKFINIWYSIIMNTEMVSRNNKARAIVFHLPMSQNDLGLLVSLQL